MGILIDLGQATKVRSVKVTVNRQLASIALRAGTTDPGNTSSGDDQVNRTFTTLGQPYVEHPGTTMVFAVPGDAEPTQFLLVWITKLPSDGDGKFSLSVNEITVSAA
jgi:hypothetical protein